jgi:hypothetical protein
MSVGTSSETRTIRAIEEYKISRHYYEPVSRQIGLSLQFYRLATRWKEETMLTSSTTQICMHPLYQRIIGMGSGAIPLILRELESEPANWFWALKAITGKDPVPPEHIGKVEQMAKDWLNWAEEEGYEW